MIFQGGTLPTSCVQSLYLPKEVCVRTRGTAAMIPSAAPHTGADVVRHCTDPSDIELLDSWWRRSRGYHLCSPFGWLESMLVWRSLDFEVDATLTRDQAEHRQMISQSHTKLSLLSFITKSVNGKHCQDLSDGFSGRTLWKVRRHVIWCKSCWRKLHASHGVWLSSTTQRPSKCTHNL